MADLTEEFDISPEFCEQYCYSKAWPLPRNNQTYQFVEDKYEVVVSGAGPAGLLLTLLLARYGLGDKSVLCIDPKPRETDIGHADGFHSRSLEVLATLGLELELTKHGRKFSELALWQGMPDRTIQRVMLGKFEFAPARFNDTTSLHQGRLERILTNDLRKYTPDGIHYGWSVETVEIDESDPEFPVVVNIRQGDKVRKVRSKYVVGADGAHSSVRRSLGIKMEGDVAEEIWGVIDFVADTDFPDIRRAGQIFAPGSNGSRSNILLIPRERMSNGDWLTRIYVDMSSDEEREKTVVVGDEQREDIRRKKAEVKKDQIFEQAAQKFLPYKLAMKKGTQPIWWATYCPGQRLAERFFVEDSSGHPRVFLIGDACHTHSPRQGQGMNISMQDAYYLAWRLAYVLNDLTSCPENLLKTYEDERRAWAYRVVTADKRWNQEGVPREVYLKELREQCTGCGIEEKPGLLVSSQNTAVEWQGKDLLMGTLRTGRRLFNVEVKRWADGTPIAIHDDFPSDGKYRILLLAAQDFPNGRSRTAVEETCAIAQDYVGLVEEVMLQPTVDDTSFSWADMPAILKQQAEMRLHTAQKSVYETYGVDSDKGALALVRPDGIVCITAALEDVEEIRGMLQRVLKLPYKTTNGTV